MTAEQRQVILYLRVSTDEQGKSGLGLEAQESMCEAYARRMGYEIAEVHCEVASGGKSGAQHRPALEAALLRARDIGSRILVAKLDRLSRDVHYISGLMARGVPFEVAEIGPEPSNMELQLRAVFAEEERNKISERTKAALAAKRARGEQVGDIGHLGKSYLQGAGTMASRARENAQRFRKVLGKYVGESFSAIARSLNEDQVVTPSGHGKWDHKMVARAMRRLELV